MTAILRYAPQGAMVMAAAARILEEGRQQIKAGSLVIDLAGISQADSAAVSVVLQWLRQARLSGCNLHFENVPASLDSLARLYGVSDFLP